MQIWPAIDIRGGQCVRLKQGDYDRETVLGNDPAEMAAHWVSQGAECLHLVDLDGARDGQTFNRKVVQKVLKEIDVPCELGGGIRDETAIDGWLRDGIQRLVVGTQALKRPDWFREMCHKYPGKLALGLDARDGWVAVEGWLETSDVTASDLAKHYADLPLAAVIYTDISKDGMMQGPNLKAMDEMNHSLEIEVIASGGVTTIEDVRALAQLGLGGCIIGRSLYEKQISLREAIQVSRQS